MKCPDCGLEQADFDEFGEPIINCIDCGYPGECPNYAEEDTWDFED